VGVHAPESALLPEALDALACPRPKVRMLFGRLFSLLRALLVLVAANQAILEDYTDQILLHKTFLLDSQEITHLQELLYKGIRGLAVHGSVSELTNHRKG
jgi:hypothetical protein